MDDEMNKLSREALARLETIDEPERRQLGHILTLLADCYGKHATGQAVLTFRLSESSLGIMGINTSDIDVSEILQEANEIMGIAITADAPNKEMFN